MFLDLYCLNLIYLKQRRRRGYGNVQAPLCRGGTDYFYKKHYFILGALLAARCVFYRIPPGALLAVGLF